MTSKAAYSNRIDSAFKAKTNKASILVKQNSAFKSRPIKVVFFMPSKTEFCFQAKTNKGSIPYA